MSALTRDREGLDQDPYWYVMPLAYAVVELVTLYPLSHPGKALLHPWQK